MCPFLSLGVEVNPDLAPAAGMLCPWSSVAWRGDETVMEKGRRWSRRGPHCAGGEIPA